MKRMKKKSRVQKNKKIKKNRWKNPFLNAVNDNAAKKRYGYHYVEQNKVSISSSDAYSQQEGSTMIHSKDFIPHDCSLCGKEIVSVHDSHNAFPLKKFQYAKEVNGKVENERCCSTCESEKVIPARMRDPLSYQRKCNKWNGLPEDNTKGKCFSSLDEVKEYFGELGMNVKIIDYKDVA
jgi:hypothetical protein